MPLTVGTAGHIDHGKTALVEALTGKNTDRLPEEHERGISIDLGYAPLELPDGTSLSVVDVPGHERFVRTMVAGASGIDLFLLVIDAGEGARPQTHEHLAILRLLGIEHGVVALTKADLVDDETLELARVEAEELVPGAPVVATSARTGAGLDELRAALAEVAAERHAARRRRRRPASTSTARSRCAGSGRSRPGRSGRGRSARATSCASSRAAARCACAACRCTTGPSSAPRRGSASPSRCRASSGSELRRGDALVTPGAFRPSFRLDVALEPLAEIPPRVMLHHGTAETLARVARVGDRFAQLRLSRAGRRRARRPRRPPRRDDGRRRHRPRPLPAAARRRCARFEALERGEVARRTRRVLVGRGVALVAGVARRAPRRAGASDSTPPTLSTRAFPFRRRPWAKAVVPHLGLERAARSSTGRAPPPSSASAPRRRRRSRRSSGSSRYASRTRRSPASSRSRAGSCASATATRSLRGVRQARARPIESTAITLAQFRDALGVGRRRRSSPRALRRRRA